MSRGQVWAVSSGLLARFSGSTAFKTWQPGKPLNMHVHCSEGSAGAAPAAAVYYQEMSSHFCRHQFAVILQNDSSL